MNECRWAVTLTLVSKNMSGWGEGVRKTSSLITRQNQPIHVHKSVCICDEDEAWSSLNTLRKMALVAVDSHIC